MGSLARFAGRAVLAGLGAVAAREALRAVRSTPRAGELERINYRGHTVSLAGGPAFAAAATATAVLGAGSPRRAAAALLAGGAAGAVGFYDDVVGARPDQKTAKGFRGHLGALREGRMTSGLVKIAGVGAASLAAAALVEAESPRPRGRLARLTAIVSGTGVIAGTANLVNLLDLRPGRALKAGAVIATPLALGSSEAAGLLAGPAGAGAALAAADLGEEIMLGDAGANAMGALVGLAALTRTGIAGRLALLGAIGALTAASEKVSFSAVIANTPGLREFDAWGRRTDHVPDGPTDRSTLPG